jgi:hypothetical protein
MFRKLYLTGLIIIYIQQVLHIRVVLKLRRHRKSVKLVVFLYQKNHLQKSVTLSKSRIQFVAFLKLDTKVINEFLLFFQRFSSIS